MSEMNLFNQHVDSDTTDVDQFLATSPNILLTPNFEEQHRDNPLLVNSFPFLTQQKTNGSIKSDPLASIFAPNETNYEFSPNNNYTSTTLPKQSIFTYHDAPLLNTSTINTGGDIQNILAASGLAMNAALFPVQPSSNSTNGSFENEDSKKSKKRKRYSKKACVHCRKAHAACEDERPCTRCQKKGLECIDSLPNENEDAPTETVLQQGTLHITAVPTSSSHQNHTPSSQTTSPTEAQHHSPSSTKIVVPCPKNNIIISSDAKVEEDASPYERVLTEGKMDEHKTCIIQDLEKLKICQEVRDSKIIKEVEALKEHNKARDECVKQDVEQLKMKSDQHEKLLLETVQQLQKQNELLLRLLLNNNASK